MVGRNPGYVTTQGEYLTDFFRSAGYETLSVSESANRYCRLVDILSTIIRRRRAIDLLLVQTYSGPSFIVADLAGGSSLPLVE